MAFGRDSFVCLNYTTHDKVGVRTGRLCSSWSSAIFGDTISGVNTMGDA